MVILHLNTSLLAHIFSLEKCFREPRLAKTGGESKMKYKKSYNQFSISTIWLSRLQPDPQITNAELKLY